MSNRMKWSLISVVAVVLFAILSAFPLGKKINLGLDLVGGMHLVLSVDTSNLPPAARYDAVERAIEIVRNRIDSFGVKEPLIARQGDSDIVVQLPGVTDRERALDLIGKTAQLEFKLVVDDQDLYKKALESKENIDGTKYQLLESKDGTPLLVLKEALLTGDAVKNAQVMFDASQYNQAYISLELNSDGAKKFAQITRENIGKRLAIVLDGIIQSAPVINEVIPNGQASITGSFTNQEASDLALVLRIGALPAPMHIAEERTVGPLLGGDSIKKGAQACLIGASLLFIFIILYYKVSGLIAVFALLLNVLIILGYLGLFGATLTLPGIAGIILTLGMAVDANVLINERIREELSAGKSVVLSIKNGFDRAFWTIVDSNLTTLIAALSLIAFGTGPIKGFALTLSVGILASMFTALVFTRLVFDFLLNSGALKEIKMRRPFALNIDFVKIGRIMLVVSAFVIIAGMSIFFTKSSEMYGIDFAGGLLQEYSFSQDIPVEKVREALAEMGKADVVIQKVKGGLNAVIIRSSEDITTKTNEALTSSLKEYSPQLIRVEKVGPTVGKILKKKALFAIGFALLGILLYVGFRFAHFDFALAAVLALVHDILICISALAIASRQIDLLVVTALLTVAGYSVNDTIVVYDRIREKMRSLKRKTFYDVLNISINETLSRTFITSLTTFLVVLSLFLFGGEVLNTFAFVLLIGVIVGTYSSLFIATPIVYLVNKGKK